MHEHVKAKWLKALRSGKYKQGKGALHRSTPDGETFCCLGVLCDLYVKDHAGAKWLRAYEDKAGVTLELFGKVGVLPQAVRLWSGLNNAVLEVRFTMPNGYAGASHLADVNDNGYFRRVPSSFVDIAKLIEEQL